MEQLQDGYIIIADITGYNSDLAAGILVVAEKNDIPEEAINQAINESLSS